MKTIIGQLVIKKTWLLHITAVFLSFAIIFSCSPLLSKGYGSGSVQVRIQIPGANRNSTNSGAQRFIHPDTKYIVVAISGDGMETASASVTVVNIESSYTIKVIDVPAGAKRTITVSLYDSAADGKILLAEGTSVLQVVADQVNSATVTAIPKSAIELPLETPAAIAAGSGGKTFVYSVNIPAACTFSVGLSDPGLIPTIYNADGTGLASSSPGTMRYPAAEAGIIFVVLTVPPDFTGSATLTVFQISSRKEITSFDFASPSAAGVIVGTNIAVTVPFGTSVTALVPTVVITGVSVSPASGIAQDFSTPVDYTVSADDGSSQVYRVTVTVALASSKEITAFSFAAPAVAGIITGLNIAVTVPFGTTVTALVPTIVFTGASVSPASGIAQDFSNPVDYTVSAADGSSQVYAVTVTIASPASYPVTITASFANPADKALVFTPAVVSMNAGSTLSITTSNAGLAALSGWKWYVDGVQTVGASAAAFGFDSNLYASSATYIISASVSESGILYAGSLSVSILPLPTVTYSITYSSQYADGGNVPLDAGQYASGTSVTIAGNSAAIPLTRTNHAFIGWTTTQNGTGTIYGPGQTASLTITSNCILYPKWSANPISVAIGQYHTVVVRADGTAWATGAFTAANNYGQLGNGSAINTPGTTTFVQVMASAGVPFTGVKAAAAGQSHTVFLKRDGTVWATGFNTNGELGTLDYAHKIYPSYIDLGVSAKHTAIAAGSNHSMVLRSDGVLSATGQGTYGALGNGLNNNTNAYTMVTNGTGVASVAAGHRFTAFITAAGNLFTTGDNSWSQLGDGTTVTQMTPAQRTTGVAFADCGILFLMVQKTDGTLWATGRNEYGQFGRGNTTNAAILVSITPISPVSSLKSFSCGSYYTMFVKTDGTLWGTGNNNWGQLGDKTAADRTTPVQALKSDNSPLTGVVQVFAAKGTGFHTFAICSDGTLWAAGNSDNGTLGNGSSAAVANLYFQQIMLPY